jgi:hypothetical protein
MGTVTYLLKMGIGYFSWRGNEKSSLSFFYEISGQKPISKSGTGTSYLSENRSQSSF